MLELRRSVLDCERFDTTIAKCTLDAADQVPPLLERATAESIQMVICRTASENLPVIQALEGAGARLMDCLIHYDMAVIATDLPSMPCGFTFRPAQPNDASAVADAARLAFSSFTGHYHADPRLPRERCDELYASWAGTSVAQQSAHLAATMLVEHQGSIVAFACTESNTTSDCESTLVGVVPGFRRLRLHKSLLQGQLAWAYSKGCRRFRSSTQLHNLSVQRNWCRMGMQPFAATTTLHLWLDTAAVEPASFPR